MFELVRYHIIYPRTSHSDKYSSLKLLLHLAGRAYSNFSFTIFWRKVSHVAHYAPTGTTDQPYPFNTWDGSGKMYDEPLERQDLIYDPYEKTGYDGMPQLPSELVASPPAGAPTFDPQVGNGARTQDNILVKTRRIFRKMSSQSSIQPLISR